MIGQIQEHWQLTSLINYYINNFNPLDKAGAYGIQDWSKVFIKKINGCYYNVVGFPIAKFYQHINDSEILKKYLIFLLLKTA